LSPDPLGTLALPARLVAEGVEASERDEVRGPKDGLAGSGPGPEYGLRGAGDRLGGGGVPEGVDSAEKRSDHMFKGCWISWRVNASECRRDPKASLSLERFRACADCREYLGGIGIYSVVDVEAAEPQKRARVPRRLDAGAK
jgi:hypothetical protein